MAPDDRSRTFWFRIYLAVALTALATLILELSITRIYSVLLYYHFAFLAISLALFGLGAGGVFSYVVAGWKGNPFTKLGFLAIANGIAVVAVLLFVLSRQGGLGFSLLAQIYFVSAIPFFFAGAILSLAISETIERVDRVYGFDLLGAGTSCLLLVPLLNSLGGPNTVLAAGLLFALSSLLWFSVSRHRAGAVLGATVAAALLALLIYNGRDPVIDVRYAKGTELRNEVFVQWNSFSRISLMRRGADAYSVEIDADANTHVPRYDFASLSESDRRRLLRAPGGLPYLLRPGAKALIIGPGAGIDVARALASGSREITGVEINPIIAETIMKERFSALSNNLYFRPEVRIVVEDGRSYVRRTPERFQVIQATLVDTWASTAAGAFALSENNLYTTEAFEEYLGHLTADGLVAFTRWGLEPPRESLRTVALAREALLRLGERDPWRHLAIVRTPNPAGALDTVLISRKPFTRADLARLRKAGDEIGFERLYLPGEPRSNPFSELLLSPDPTAFLSRYRYDVSPVSDDRPFFFYTVQTRDLWNFLGDYLKARGRGITEVDQRINVAIPALFGMMGVSLLAVLVILALPPVLLRTRLPRDGGVPWFLLYFLCIGIGYILVEIALIQRLILFLGHPTYSLTVIVFSMLIGSGVGSYFSRRVLAGSEGRLRLNLILVSLLVGLLALFLVGLLERGIGLPLGAKIALTVLVIFPLGFVMGMPFPTGLRKLEERSPQSVRWAWSINAAASVLGSVSAIFLAIHLGLRATLLAGGVLYLAAAAVLWMAAARTADAKGRRDGASRQAPPFPETSIVKEQADGGLTASP